MWDFILLQLNDNNNVLIKQINNEILLFGR